VDNTSLKLATITLTNASAQDVLSFGTLPTGITRSVDSLVGGVLTVQLSATSGASVASFQTALRQLTYSNTSENPNTAARFLSVTVDDDTSAVGVSNIATRTINVTSVNDAPTITPLTEPLSATEQISFALSGGALAVADVDTTSLTVTVSVNSGTLSATLGSNTDVTLNTVSSSSISLTGSAAQINQVLVGANSANLSYVINSDAPVGSDQLTVTVTDGLLSSSKTQTIAITAVNDAPVLDLSGASVAGYDGTAMFSSGLGAVALAPVAAMSDADSTNFKSIVVSIASGDRQANDVLGLNLAASQKLSSAGFTSSYSNGCGLRGYNRI
jgi:hypothetical protein